MKPYRIQEADLVIPPEWSDQSLNIFKIPPNNGIGEASFLISRDTYAKTQVFADYLSDQLQKIQTQLPEFSLKKNERFDFQGNQGGWFEYTWKNNSSVLYIRQVFYALGSKVLICTLTTAPEDIAHHDVAWRCVMSSMKLMPVTIETAPDFPPKNG